MNARTPTPPLRPRDRLAAWLVTGPLGRVAAFFADLGAYMVGALRTRLARRRPTPKP